MKNVITNRFKSSERTALEEKPSGSTLQRQSKRSVWPCSVHVHRCFGDLNGGRKEFALSYECEHEALDEC